MPFMTYNLKEIVATKEVKETVMGLLAKRFTTPVGTLIQIHGVYRVDSKLHDGEYDEYLQDGLVIILSVVHSKYHAYGMPYFLNVMNTTAKEVFDFDKLDYTENEYHARQVRCLQIRKIGEEGEGAHYDPFNYHHFVDKPKSSNVLSNTIIKRLHNEK